MVGGCLCGWGHRVTQLQHSHKQLMGTTAEGADHVDIPCCGMPQCRNLEARWPCDKRDDVGVPYGCQQKCQDAYRGMKCSCDDDPEGPGAFAHRKGHAHVTLCQQAPCT